MSLRLKLFIAASLMLVFPVAGYRYVQGMEAFLRQDQSRAVLATAKALSIALQTRVELFREDAFNPGESTELTVQPLPFAPLIDGYDQEWESLALPRRLSTDQLIAGRYEQYLYLLLGIKDSRINFNGMRVSRPPQGDFLKLIMTDKPGYERSWILAADAPGLLSLNEIAPPRGEILSAYPDSRLQGAVQMRPGGYVMEVRIPVALLGTTLSLEINDDQSRTRQLPASGDYVLRFPSQAISRWLDNIGPSPGQRIWVTDQQRRVLARRSGPDSAPRQALPPLLRLLLPDMETGPLDQSGDDNRLSGPELDSALAGTPVSHWRQQPDQGRYRLSAGYPVRKGDKVVGAVVVEQDAQDILALRLRALAELLVSSLLSFTVAGLGLLFVASSMVRRLRRLRQAAARSIDSTGRIRDHFEAPAGNDEISDLGKSFALLFSRLAQYNQYLEQLASRLSHELRTPLAIIRSSLDNLAMTRTDTDPGTVYQQRARQGVDRLETIIKRMAEASRLEQALTSTEMQPIDIVKLIHAGVVAHQQAWPAIPVETHLPEGEALITASPDLLLQALDKLLANARDFRTGERPIRVELKVRKNCVDLVVENYGPLLPPGEPGHLFESMVSHRATKGSDRSEPHLGLGLYVVRLVAECHGGKAFAANLDNGQGVRLGFRFDR